MGKQTKHFEYRNIQVEIFHQTQGGKQYKGWSFNIGNKPYGHIEEAEVSSDLRSNAEQKIDEVLGDG